MPEAWCGTVAKRRSSRRKQPNTDNGAAAGAGNGSTVSEAVEDSAMQGADTQDSTAIESAATSEMTGTSIEGVVATGENLLARLQAALTDLDGKLAAADRTLESLADGIDFPEVLGETLEALQTTVDQLKRQLPEAVRYNTESIVALHAQVAELENASAQSSDGGTGVDEAAIAELRGRIQELGNQLNDGDDGELKQAIAECQQRIETELHQREGLEQAVRSQIAKLEEQLAEPASLPTEILELPNTLKALQATVGELESRQRDTSGTEDIEASIRSLQSATESLEAQFAEAIANRSDDTWQAPMSELDTQLKGLTSQLDGLQQQLPKAVSVNTQSIVSLTEQLIGVEDSLKQLSEAGGETDGGWQTAVSELTAELEKLQQQLPEAVSVNTQSIVSLSGQLGGLEAALEQVAEADSGTDEGLQAAVSELAAKVDELQQQLPEAVSINTQSIVSLTEQLTEIEGALKQVTDASERDESKAAIAQLEQAVVSVNQQLAEVEGALKAIPDASEADESKAAIAQLEQSLSTVEEQLQQALSVTELVDGLQTAQQSLQQSLEAQIQDAIELINRHPSAEQFSELQSRLESGKRVGSLEAIIQRAEALEQKPSEPPTWEVDLEEVRKSVQLLSRRIPEAYQLNSEMTARLGEQINELQAQVTQLADRPQPTVTPEILEELQTAIASMQAAQTELKTQLDAIPAAPEEPTETDLADTEPVDTETEKTEAIQAAVTELSERLDSLSQKLPEAVKYNTQSIVGLQEQLAGLESRSEENGELASIASTDPAESGEPVSDSEGSSAIAQLEAHLAKIEAADERLEMMEISYDDIDKRMDAVDLKVMGRASEEDLQEVRAELALRADAQELDQALGQLHELKDAIAHPVPLWQEDIDEIRARLEAVVAQLPEVIQFNTETAVQLETQVTALQQQFTQLQAEDETASTIAQLEEQLTALQDSLNIQGQAKELVEETVRSLGQDVSQLSDRLEQMAEQARLREEENDSNESANTEPWRGELEEISNRLQETVATVEQQVAFVSELEQRIGQPLEVSAVDVSEADREEAELEDAELENAESEDKGPEDSVPSGALVQLRTDVDALQPILEKSSELENQLSTFATTLYALQSTITPLEQQLPEALRYNRQSVVELHEQMDELRAQMQESVSSEASEAQATAAELDTLHAQYGALQEQMERVKTELRDSQSEEAISVNTIQAESRELREQVETLAVRLRQAESLGLENELAALQTECRGLQGQLETIRARAESTATGSTATQSALAELQADYRQLQGGYRQLQKGWERDRDELTQLRQALSELEGTVAEKSDTSAIAPIQTELNNLLALQERQNQQAQQEELREDLSVLNTQFVQLEQQLPEAIRLNTLSIVALQEKETQLEGDMGTQVEELRAEVAGLLAQQQSLKVWLISTVGVALVASAAAVGQVLGWQVGG
ncbi:MAG: hypothetical protein AB4050_01545 [Synechococcus sp.]